MAFHLQVYKKKGTQTHKETLCAKDLLVIGYFHFSAVVNQNQASSNSHPSPAMVLVLFIVPLMVILCLIKSTCRDNLSDDLPTKLS